MELNHSIALPELVSLPLPHHLHCLVHSGLLHHLQIVHASWRVVSRSLRGLTMHDVCQSELWVQGKSVVQWGLRRGFNSQVGQRTRGDKEL
jgi:hypothetical protein